MLIEKTFVDGHKQISCSTYSLDEIIAAQKQRNNVHKARNLQREYVITAILNDDLTVNKTNTDKFVAQSKPEVSIYDI